MQPILQNDSVLGKRNQCKKLLSNNRNHCEHH